MTRPMHIYAFGSICRGEISPGSDVDLLAVVTGGPNNLSRSVFSIYSHAKIDRIWKDGNPFAWHLHLEAKLVHGSDNRDYLRELGAPTTYSKSRNDCERFIAIFKQAQESVSLDLKSIVFDLSTAFLGLRNFSSCYLLGRGRPDFSRGAALGLMGRDPPVDMDAYRILERARLLCTRGYGAALTQFEMSLALNALPALQDWMIRLHDKEIYGG
jgi:nucleotidyltransferase-like protein